MNSTETPKEVAAVLKQAGGGLVKYVEGFHLEELDFIGQKLPDSSKGDRAMGYFVLAVLCLLPPVQGAWALLGFNMLPVGLSLSNAIMAIRSLAKGVRQEAKEYEEEEARRQDLEDDDEVVRTVETSAAPVKPAPSPAPTRRQSFTTQPSPTPQPQPRPTPAAPSGGITEPNPFARQTPSPAPAPQPAPPVDTTLPSAPVQAELPPELQPLSQAETKKAMSRFLAPDIAEFTQLPMKERAEKLLDLMATSGCDLWPYVSDAILVFNGMQQSGKTTLAMVITILEAAFYGKEINYVTGDGDIYPLAFSGIADGSEFYPLLAGRLLGLKKDQGGNTIWVVDEISKQPIKNVEPVWNALLTGFVKTLDTARIITHGTTSDTMKLPRGWADQAKGEITVLAGKRVKDISERSTIRRLQYGGRYPSGQYRRQEYTKDHFVDSDDENLKLPEWLQFDTNDKGNPCYVRSLLRYFPELDTRADGPAPQPLFPDVVSDGEADEPEKTSEQNFDKERAALQSLLNAVDEDADPLADVSELAQKLFAWATEGAGKALWQQKETQTALLTVILREDFISKGSRHRVSGETKSFHAFELADAISELVAIRKLSKTTEGHVVIKTEWKGKA